MNWAVVVLNGPKKYLTLGTILYGKYGEKTQQHVITCDTWQQGFQLACDQGFEAALFVKAGTVFTDWDAWCKLLNSYPHQGLVAHIIYYPDQPVYLDDQCWFMNLSQFSLADFEPGTIHQPVPVRSEKNLHDHYTPLWVKPGVQFETIESAKFGQGIIARQLNSNKSIANWNNSARDIKRFEYNTGDAQVWLKDYIELAESQLWVFNNEPITVNPAQHVITPGSGLYWMLHKCHPDVRSIDIIDISSTQLEFCRQLHHNWNGQNYGQFVWDHIKRNQLIHYELDRFDITPLERLYFKKQQYFVDYANKIFEQAIEHANIKDFASVWNNSTCQVNIRHGNLADQYAAPPGSCVWMSNVLEYKYTLITTNYNSLIKHEKANQ